MARAQWPLQHGRPIIEIVLTLAQGAQKVTRRLLADTGAGAMHDPFDIVLDEVDCLMCGGKPSKMVPLGGSYSGTHPIYVIPIGIPSLGFRDSLFAVGVAAPPAGFDGIACFRFLNRFTYGNFGNANEFALET
ncbi:MAG: hypothetical protein EXR98_07085 [Gemmataceae bacterium]|nr:hypothetical protein [Gemmataceae bacterium]